MKLIRQGKSCGCLIASNVIELEVKKRKLAEELQNLRAKISRAHDKPRKSLKSQEKELLSSISATAAKKKAMKKRFEHYVKKSGYVPPKFKER